MVEVAKPKSGRSITRLFGQSIDASGNVTGAPIELRIAYPFHFEKRTKSAGGAALDKPRNDAVVMAPKVGVGGDCPNYKLLCAFLMEAAVDAWKAWPVGYNPKIQDGDVPHRPKPKPGVTPLTEEQIQARNAWRRGYWIVEVATPPSKSPKVCLMQNGQFVEIPAQKMAGQELFKSGDYGYVSMNAYTFENPQNFGVNFGYEGVLYSRPGELIGNASGPRSATQMFGSVAGMATTTAPVMPSAAPVMPTMPQPAIAQPPAAPVMLAPPAPPAPIAAAPVMPTMPAPPMAPAVAPPPGMPTLPAFPTPQ